ncbi:DUF6789 family protein [Erythrobacter alti]|uniref:DUF6789 family protein n=1 Tax=Erythrobacter alti TaxID=1896145 RepID=UPI0030F495F7
MKNGIIAGLVAGLVFVIVEMLLVPTVGGGSAFGPPRMIAAIAMGPEVLPPPATFELPIFIVGMLVHFALSAILGLIFALITARMKLSRALLIAAGAVFGLIVYFVNFYGFTAVFPWFEMARNPISIFAHLVFGVVLGWWISRKSTILT